MCAETGIFYHNGYRDLRVIGGCVADIQCMIAMARGDAAFNILFTLLNGDHLRGSGFACAYVLGSDERCSAGTFFIDSDQRVLDDRKVLGLEVYDAWRLRCDNGTSVRNDVLDVVHEMWTEQHSVVGDGSDCLCELQRSVGVVTLTNADTDGFSWVPFLIEAAHFPVL